MAGRSSGGGSARRAGRGFLLRYDRHAMLRHAPIPRICRGSASRLLVIRTAVEMVARAIGSMPRCVGENQSWVLWCSS